MSALARALRAVAVVIAVAGVIDPGCTRARVGPREVAVVHGSTPHDTALAGAVSAPLRARGVQVVPAPTRHTSATVVVGTPRPSADAEPRPVVVFAPDAVELLDVSLPTRVHPSDAVVVGVTLAARRDAAAVVELLDGPRVVARDSQVMRAGGRAQLALSWAPTFTGPHALTVQLATDNATVHRRVTRAVLVDSPPWRVLSYDARPSWTATFVRRALGRDPRFSVRSRVVTSRAPQARASVATPRAPTSLAALDAAAIDVLLVGAPAALTSTEWAALRRLVADEGVPAILLPDEGTPALAAWLGIGAWRVDQRTAPVALPRTPADSLAALRAQVIGVARALPEGAEPVVSLGDTPVVWRQPMGAGDVLVSGAFDAWRYRDPAQSAFDAAWREWVAGQAARRPPAIAAEPASLTLAPGERALVTIASRAPVVARWVAESGETRAVPVAPTTEPAAWRVWTPALPATAASSRGVLRLETAVDSVSIPWVLDTVSAATRATGPALALAAPEVTEAWARAHGGKVVTTPDSIVAAVDVATEAATEAAVAAAGAADQPPLPWHPMRSGWWILPFALALGGEWWLRRRDGRA